MCKKDANKYAYLDQLSTRELREILRADIDSPESGDDEAIFYILEVMEKRERKHPLDASSDLDRCWNDFQTHYHTPEGAGRALYPTGDPEARKETSHVRSVSRRRVRWAVLAAVVALLVVSLTVPVAGFANFFEMIGTWTAQQFTITTDREKSGGPTDDFEGAQVFEETPGDALRQVLAEYGITEAVVPTWMPEGFKLQGEVFVQDLSFSKQLHFLLSIQMERKILASVLRSMPEKQRAGSMRKRQRSRRSTWPAEWSTIFSGGLIRLATGPRHITMETSSVSSIPHCRSPF